jgi:murein DD-endopeptidase MepM/ murein hydrolase activator NlpD
MGSGKNGVNILASLFLNIFLLTSILMPFSAKASVFSFISDLFSSTEVDAEEVGVNFQNIELLQATISPNQKPEEKEEATIVDGTSLLPDVQKPTDTKTINEDQISLYVVHKGDTLPAIAKMFGVSVNTIKWGNDINGNSISVGQTLVILPISGVQHIVKSGDTIQSITKKYKGDLDEVLQYNNLSRNSKLAVGDIIVVPDGEVTVISSNTGSVNRKAPSYPVYEGYYMRPIIGGVKTQGLHDRYAVDLASSYGSNILASATGDVLIARTGWNGGYGTYIIIKHSNGTQTVYAHLSALLVSAGDHVEQGQVIGKMGNTGRVRGSNNGTHLHFEVRGARNPF